eukprot:1322-Heterococcus_DN1.PRE.4
MCNKSQTAAAASLTATHANRAPTLSNQPTLVRMHELVDSYTQRRSARRVLPMARSPPSILLSATSHTALATASNCCRAQSTSCSQLSMFTLLHVRLVQPGRSAVSAARTWELSSGRTAGTTRESTRERRSRTLRSAACADLKRACCARAACALDGMVTRPMPIKHLASTIAAAAAQLQNACTSTASDSSSACRSTCAVLA